MISFHFISSSPFGVYPNVSFTRTIFRVRRIVLQPGQRVKNPEAKGIKRGLFLSSVLNS